MDGLHKAFKRLQAIIKTLFEPLMPVVLVRREELIISPCEFLRIPKIWRVGLTTSE
jgi:hypothetical protein